MTERPLLVNIAVALACALVGGLMARRLRLPTIVGYLLAGVALGDAAMAVTTARMQARAKPLVRAVDTPA